MAICCFKTGIIFSHDIGAGGAKVGSYGGAGYRRALGLRPLFEFGGSFDQSVGKPFPALANTEYQLQHYSGGQIGILHYGSLSVHLLLTHILDETGVRVIHMLKGSNMFLTKASLVTMDEMLGR